MIGLKLKLLQVHATKNLYVKKKIYFYATMKLVIVKKLQLQR